MEEKVSKKKMSTTKKVVIGVIAGIAIGIAGTIYRKQLGLGCEYVVKSAKNLVSNIKNKI